MGAAAATVAAPETNNRPTGMLWILRTGAPWRDLPERYGPSQTVATRFYRWGKARRWDRLLANQGNRILAFATTRSGDCSASIQDAETPFGRLTRHHYILRSHEMRPRRWRRIG